MMNQHNKKGENLRRFYFLIFLLVLSSCKLTKPRGGFEIQLTAEKITDHNVRIKILDASTGLPLQVTYIAFKKKRKLKNLKKYQEGELTLKIPNRRTRIRTAAIPYYDNEFVIKPHKTNVIEVISYQVPDTKPLYCK